ncbi:hypothetical protein SAMN05444161_4650 [Rhizobiales bacterium GAS191]|nr:hypothetical protein SAMN05444161_4650 [Rhizobiales bacterium GAS191]
MRKLIVDSFAGAAGLGGGPGRRLDGMRAGAAALGAHEVAPGGQDRARAHSHASMPPEEIAEAEARSSELAGPYRAVDRAGILHMLRYAAPPGRRRMAVLPPPITIIAETPPKALAGLARGRAWCRRPVTVPGLGWPANCSQLSKVHNSG